MSLQQNKARDRLLVEEAFNRGNLAVAHELIAPDFVDHAAPPGLGHGADSFNAAVATFRVAFPDLHVTMEEQLAAGDRVAHRVTLRGTHRGDFFGIPPTGKTMAIGGIHLVRFAGEQISEHWGINDDVAMLQQLGVVAAPEQPARNPNDLPARQAPRRDPAPSAEQNMALIHRLIDAFWNEGQAAVFDEVFAPDYVDHTPAPGQTPDREGFRQLAAAFRVALPDMHSTVDDLVPEDDRVAWRYTLVGTHQGPVLGIPATGKPVTLTGITIDRFAGGQIVERWAQLDTLGLLRQLGVMPPPEQAGVG